MIILLKFIIWWDNDRYNNRQYKVNRKITFFKFWVEVKQCSWSTQSVPLFYGHTVLHIKTFGIISYSRRFIPVCEKKIVIFWRFLIFDIITCTLIGYWISSDVGRNWKFLKFCEWGCIFINIAGHSRVPCMMGIFKEMKFC